jgi:hypothetical protein
MPTIWTFGQQEFSRSDHSQQIRGQCVIYMVRMVDADRDYFLQRQLVPVKFNEGWYFGSHYTNWRRMLLGSVGFNHFRCSKELLKKKGALAFSGPMPYFLAWREST